MVIKHLTWLTTDKLREFRQEGHLNIILPDLCDIYHFLAAPRFYGTSGQKPRVGDKLDIS